MIFRGVVQNQCPIVLIRLGRQRKFHPALVRKFPERLNRPVAQVQVLPDALVPPAALAAKSELACLHRREMAQADQSQAASAPIDGLFGAVFTAQSAGDMPPGNL
jgi:hypothetical protein